jgi:AcrR family transcriptional regulator
MPRTQEAYQNIRATRREQILQAAARVFARRGLADTTVAEIAVTAGVSHGLLYRHFASKDEVFAAIVEQSLGQARQLAQAALVQPGTGWDRLRWITTHIFPGRPLGNRPQYFLVVLYALTNESVPEHVHRMALQQGESIHEVIRQFIVEGQQSGHVRSGDPEQLTVLFLSCIQGLVLDETFRQRTEATFPTVDMVLHILQAGV